MSKPPKIPEPGLIVHTPVHPITFLAVLLAIAGLACVGYDIIRYMLK